MVRAPVLLARDRSGRGDSHCGGKHGYANDNATGMQLLGARYYLPQLGRFLTQDPIGHEGGLNLYAYCSNSPLLRVDPDGTQNVTIAGDTHGYAAPGWALPDYWGSVNGPTRKVVYNLFLSNSGVTIWGHGAPGAASFNAEQSLTAHDLRYLARLRKAAGLGKLEFLSIDQCNVMQKDDFVLAALELSKEVRGYIDWTIDPFDGYKLGRKMIYRSAADVYADNALVRTGRANVAKKGKSDEKVRGGNKYKNLPDTK